MDAGVGELIDIEEFPPRRAGAVDHDIRGTAESEQRRGCRSRSLVEPVMSP
jgi:hypothetical protein